MHRAYCVIRSLWRACNSLLRFIISELLLFNKVFDEGESFSFDQARRFWLISLIFGFTTVQCKVGDSFIASTHSEVGKQRDICVGRRIKLVVPITIQFLQKQLFVPKAELFQHQIWDATLHVERANLRRLSQRTLEWVGREVARVTSHLNLLTLLALRII